MRLQFDSAGSIEMLGSNPSPQSLEALSERRHGWWLVEGLLDTLERPATSFGHVRSQHGDGPQGKPAKEEVGAKGGLVEQDGSDDGDEKVGELENQYL